MAVRRERRRRREREGSSMLWRKNKIKRLILFITISMNITFGGKN